MTWFDRLLGRAPETRRQDISWTALEAFGPTGNAVTARQAEGLSTILACVSTISTAIASLPAWVFRRSDNGRGLDDAHALMRLIRRGRNPHQTWVDFIEWLIASALLRGNPLAETGASHELQLDLSGFLRGDPEARWAPHEIAVKNRILTPNEVRLVEGWNARDGGDDFPQAAPET